MDIFTLFRWS